MECLLLVHVQLEVIPVRELLEKLPVALLVLLDLRVLLLRRFDLRAEVIEGRDLLRGVTIARLRPRARVLAHGKGKAVVVPRDRELRRGAIGKARRDLGDHPAHRRRRRLRVAIAHAHFHVGTEGQEREDLCAAPRLERMQLVAVAVGDREDEARRSAEDHVDLDLAHRHEEIAHEVVPPHAHSERRGVEVAVVPSEGCQFHRDSR